jgi:CheY-like chemotaxis protein
MSKIMLVEDDNNLREIYEARLLAEGYEIVAAKDGEEALALAVKERPDLIIADVMMPKISGFDMLDILRTTPETRNTKVIMMTALSQAEDKARAEKLGADRYLVKSQVTLEDVAKVTREVLEGKSDTNLQAADTTTVTPAPEPALGDAIPVTPAPEPAADTSGTSTSEPQTSDAAIITPVPEPPVADEPADQTTTPTDDADDHTEVHGKVITPLNDPDKEDQHLQELVAAEVAKEPAPRPEPTGPIVSDMEAPSESAPKSDGTDPNSISL